MSLMRNRVRLWIVVGLLLTAVGGCASWSKKKVAALPPPTEEQLAFWDANREHAHYVPGKGYAIDGAPGFYDDQGRPIPAELLAETARPDSNFDVEGESFSDRSKRITNNWKKLWGKGPNEKIAKAAFAEGDSLFRQAKYAEAAKQFKIAYDRGPDLPQEEDTLFKCAESYFFSDQYSKANDFYGILVKKYSNTGYLDQIVARRFAIARYWEDCDHKKHHYALTPNIRDKTRPHFDTRGHCLKCYDRVRLDDPTGPLADDSIMASANAYFSWGMYEDADYFYTLLQKEYPRSEHQFNAHLLGFKVKLLRYQGPDYGNKPLDEADELAKQLMTQFPTELGEERQRIIDAQSQIARNAPQPRIPGGRILRQEQVLRCQPGLLPKRDQQLARYAIGPEVQSSHRRVQRQTGAPTPPFAWVEKIAAAGKDGQLGLWHRNQWYSDRHGTGESWPGNAGWHGLRQPAGRTERYHDSLTAGQFAAGRTKSNQEDRKWRRQPLGQRIAAHLSGSSGRWRSCSPRLPELLLFGGAGPPTVRRINPSASDRGAIAPNCARSWPMRLTKQGPKPARLVSSKLPSCQRKRTLPAAVICPQAWDRQHPALAR